MSLKPLQNVADVIAEQQRLRQLGDGRRAELLTVFLIKVPAPPFRFIVVHEQVQPSSHAAVEGLHPSRFARRKMSIDFSQW